MATVIDSLVLELGLDSSKFSDEQRKALDLLRKYEDAAVGSGKRIESETKRVGDLLSNFRREALTTVGVLMGGRGLQEFIGFMTSLDATTGRVARQMNMATEEVSEWQGALQQVGGSAESANAALQAMNGEVARFRTTGESSMLPALSAMNISMQDVTGRWKTAGEIWMEIGRWASGKDAQAVMGMLQNIPGANQDMANFILKGADAMQRYIKEAREAGATTKDAAAAAEEYQRSMSLLTRSASALGRELMLVFGPAALATMDAFKRGLNSLRDTPEQRKANEPTVMNEREAFNKAAREKFGAPSDWMTILGSVGVASAVMGPLGLLFGLKAADKLLGPSTPAAPTAAPTGALSRSPAARRSGALSYAEQVAMIRKIATEEGVDPAVALQVAHSEGLNRRGAFAVGDDKSSFGPFQLHYGGLAGGPNAGKGLGDVFTKQTGLHASDPATIEEQVRFSMRQAKTNGWGPWHGWRGLPFAGINRDQGRMASEFTARATAAGPGAAAPPGSARSVMLEVGNIHINAPQASDASGIAKEIGPALNRELTAGSINQGSF